MSDDFSGKSRDELNALAAEQGLDPASFPNVAAITAALRGETEPVTGSTQAQELARVANQTSKENQAEFSELWDTYKETGTLPEGSYRFTGSRFANLIR